MARQCLPGDHHGSGSVAAGARVSARRPARERGLVTSLMQMAFQRIPTTALSRASPRGASAVWAGALAFRRNPVDTRPAEGGTSAGNPVDSDWSPTADGHR